MRLSLHQDFTVLDSLGRWEMSWSVWMLITIFTKCLAKIFLPLFSSALTFTRIKTNRSAQSTTLCETKPNSNAPQQRGSHIQPGPQLKPPHLHSWPTCLWGTWLYASPRFSLCELTLPILDVLCGLALVMLSGGGSPEVSMQHWPLTGPFYTPSLPRL